MGRTTDLGDALLGVVDGLALEQRHAPKEHRHHTCTTPNDEGMGYERQNMGRTVREDELVEVDLENDGLGGGRELEAVEELQPLGEDRAKDRACGCGARVSTRPVSACARAPRSAGVGARTAVERYARGSGELRRVRAREG